MDLFQDLEDTKPQQKRQRQTASNDILIYKISKCITSKNTEFDRLRLRVIDELKK